MDEKHTLAENFPSNSKVKRQEVDSVEKPKKVEKVINGTVTRQKSSIGKRAAEFLFEDDTKSVGQYILHDVLLPAFKAALSDMVGGGLDMMLFGERRGSRTRRDGGRSSINYGSLSRMDDRDRRDPRDFRDRRDISRESRSRFDFDEIVIPTRGEAEIVLSRMADLVDEYGSANVADLYDLLGIESNYAENKWGWTSARDFGITRARRGAGYMLDLPRPRPLD